MTIVKAEVLKTGEGISGKLQNNNSLTSFNKTVGGDYHRTHNEERR